MTIDETTYLSVKQFVNAEIKSVQSINAVEDPVIAKEIDECMEILERQPDDHEVTKKIGLLLMEGDDPVQAYDYLKKALEMKPEDDRLKVVFAECSLKLGGFRSIRLRGSRSFISMR